MFVSGNVIRYQAPDEPRTTRTTFTVRDEHGNLGSGELTILVHESNPEAKAPPKPRNITARAYAGETIRIPIPLTGIDVDGDGVTLLGLGDQAPTQGFISAQGATWLEYTASRTARGTDVFTYAVEDWTGQRVLATVELGWSKNQKAHSRLLPPMMKSPSNLAPTWKCVCSVTTLTPPDWTSLSNLCRT